MCYCSLLMFSSFLSFFLLLVHWSFLWCCHTNKIASFVVFKKRSVEPTNLFHLNYFHIFFTHRTDGNTTSPSSSLSIPFIDHNRWLCHNFFNDRIGTGVGETVIISGRAMIDQSWGHFTGTLCRCCHQQPAGRPGRRPKAPATHNNNSIIMAVVVTSPSTSIYHHWFPPLLMWWILMMNDGTIPIHIPILVITTDCVVAPYLWSIVFVCLSAVSTTTTTTITTMAAVGRRGDCYRLLLFVGSNND